MATSQGQREEPRERQGEEQPGDCQNYGGREDSSNAGRVLPVLSGCAVSGGGQVSGNNLGTVAGPLICWKPVWFSGELEALSRD